MIRRFVFDGAPGSGKTMLLTGKGQDPFDSPVECLRDLGFQIIPESIDKVGKQMALEGKPTAENFPELLRRTLELEVLNLTASSDHNLVLHDKSLFGYLHVAKMFNVDIAPFLACLNNSPYQSPIFLCEPLLDFSFPHASPHKRNLCSQEFRLGMHKAIMEGYLSAGYSVVELPVFSKDFLENNRKRINAVLEYL